VLLRLLASAITADASDDLGGEESAVSALENGNGFLQLFLLSAVEGMN
jgi:hypothetical protein